MHRVDRWVGLGLTLLGSIVVGSGRTFPDVPGQKLGAAFLPMLVGGGLVVCGLLLMLRGWRAARASPLPAATATLLREEPGAGSAHSPHPEADRSHAPGAEAAPVREQLGPPVSVIATVACYIGLSPVLGFLLVAPPCLVVLFRALGVGWKPAFAWAVIGTLVVHVAFYKLLRVPLPWGVLRPFY